MLLGQDNDRLSPSPVLKGHKYGTFDECRYSDSGARGIATGAACECNFDIYRHVALLKDKLKRSLRVIPINRESVDPARVPKINNLDVVILRRPGLVSRHNNRLQCGM